MYNLKIPATILEPDPAVRNNAGLVCQHGHGWFGRRPTLGERSSDEMIAEINQYDYDFSLSMMRAGYTIIAIDLFNFGEREIIKRPGGRDKCDMVEIFLQLFNINLMALKIAEIRQAITVLSEYKNVDPERIGMVGLSQGGRMTMFNYRVGPTDQNRRHLWRMQHLPGSPETAKRSLRRANPAGTDARCRYRRRFRRNRATPANAAMGPERSLDHRRILYSGTGSHKKRLSRCRSF